MPMITHDQLATLDGYFQLKRSQVPVLAQRAATEGVERIAAPEHVIALLFPHTTYKSYPESLMAKGRWDQMTKWLNSLSAHRTDNVDVSGVDGIDDWIERLAEAGHFVSSSSGTTGKNSFLNASATDRDVSRSNIIQCMELATGFAPDNSWTIVSVGPETGVRRHNEIREALMTAYARHDNPPFPVVGPPPTGYFGYLQRLSAMRRAMAAGTAAPDDVASFEAEAAERRATLTQRFRLVAEQLMGLKDERIFFTATFPMIHQLVGIVEGMGAKPGDWTGANAMMTGGGLKGVALPPNYQTTIFSMFNIAPSRFLHYYSMQELNQRFAKCSATRYHVPSTVVMLILDQGGEALEPLSGTEVMGRASFVDTSIDGRWGGFITGDRVHADYGTCPCGRPGPTVFDDIVRYADLVDDDKITCAGTMDAYVRGLVEE